MAQDIAYWKKQYEIAEKNNDPVAMKAANDAANAIRTANGEAPQVANVAISNMEQKTGISASGGSSSGNRVSSGGSGGGTSATVNASTQPDYTTRIQQMMDAGASPEEVRALWNERNEYVNQHPELEQYRYDNHDAVMAYINGDNTSVPAQGEVEKPETVMPEVDEGLSDAIREQQAAALEAELAALKIAYDKSMTGYQSVREQLPDVYDAARNRAASNSARARREFVEHAQAHGLNSGITGQEELARSSVLTSTLAGIDREEAGKLAELNLEEASLTAQYENAIAQAKATGNAALASALYDELIRVQEQQRDDAHLAAQLGDNSLVNQLLGINAAAGGNGSSGNKGGTSVSGGMSGNGSMGVGKTTYTGTSANGGTYTITSALGIDFIENKPVGATMVGGDGSKWTKTSKNTITIEKNGEVFTVNIGTIVPTVETGGYNNGNLSTDDVKLLQAFFNGYKNYNLEVDGFWGQNSQNTTGMSANEAWEEYQNYLDQTQNYSGVAALAEQTFATDGKEAVLEMLRKAYSTGAITLTDYKVLYNKYRG